MSELIWQGLGLSLAGLSLTFAGLGILIVAIFLLERIFRTRPLVPETRTPEESRPPDSLSRDPHDEEVAAAIAAALTHLNLLDVSRGRLGNSLEGGRGPWWVMGQAEQRTAQFRQPGRRK